MSKRVTAPFPRRLTSVAEARHFAEHVLHEWGLVGSQAGVGLVVTELTTNSVLHAHSEFEVILELDDELLRIGVSDRSPHPPVLKTRGVGATTGRGMRLVAALVDGWEVDPQPDGKTVWCRLRVASVTDGGGHAWGVPFAPRASEPPPAQSHGPLDHCTLRLREAARAA